MMASGLVEFPDSVSLTFDCGMWAAFRNPLEILGTDGLIEVPYAYSLPEDGGNFYLTNGDGRQEIEVPVANAYSEQGDQLAEAILNRTPLRYSAEDAIRNMRVIDACLLSAEARKRVTL